MGGDGVPRAESRETRERRATVRGHPGSSPSCKYSVERRDLQRERDSHSDIPFACIFICATLSSGTMKGSRMKQRSSLAAAALSATVRELCVVYVCVTSSSEVRLLHALFAQPQEAGPRSVDAE